MNTVNANDVKEFQMRNLHATGQSYISALENETKYSSINGVEEVMKFLKNQMKSFKNERTGIFSRWEYLSMHFCQSYFETLKDNDIEDFNRWFKRSNTIEISEIKGKHFEIIVTRNSDLFDVVVKTYAYIAMNESAIHYLDEEQAKVMIARKLTFLKKNE